MDQEFHDRCAQLALAARTTHASSAPCDTRLRLRPSSGSAQRRDAPTQTEQRTRPKTAPIGTPKAECVDKNAATGAVGDESAFLMSMHDMSSGTDRQNMEKPREAFVEQSTEVVLPNSVTPEDIPQVNLQSQSKRVRIAATIDMNPLAQMTRERAFIKQVKSPRAVSVKSPRGLVKVKHTRRRISREEIQTVSSIGPANKKTETGEGNLTEGKTDIKQTNSAKSVTACDQNLKVRTKEPVSKTDGITPASKNKVKDNLTKENAAISQPVAVQAKEESTKSLAFSILQKLTGKGRSKSHKAGQVPNVQRLPRQLPVKTKQQVEDQEVAEKSKTEMKPKTQTEKQIKTGKEKTYIKEESYLQKRKIQRSVSCKGEREFSDRRQRDVRNLYERGDKKPASASRIHQDEDMPEGTTDLGHKAVRRSEREKKEKVKHFESEKDRKSDEKSSQDKDASDNEQRRAKDVHRSKSLRMQNALISTSLETSAPSPVKEESSSPAPQNLHPKYKDSPYLRDNPLLQSGRLRRRQGQGSAGHREGHEGSPDDDKTIAYQ